MMIQMLRRFLRALRLGVPDCSPSLSPFLFNHAQAIPECGDSVHVMLVMYILIGHHTASRGGESFMVLADGFYSQWQDVQHLLESCTNGTQDHSHA